MYDVECVECRYVKCGMPIITCSIVQWFVRQAQTVANLMFAFASAIAFALLCRVAVHAMPSGEESVDHRRPIIEFDIDEPLSLGADDALGFDDRFLNGSCSSGPDPDLPAKPKRHMPPSSSNQRYNPEKKGRILPTSQTKQFASSITFWEFAKQCADAHTMPINPEIDYSHISNSDDFDDFEDMYIHCKGKLEKVLERQPLYIGITFNPTHRWENGHKINRDRAYKKMVVLVKAPCELTRSLEISLVHHFKNGKWRDRCLNCDNSPSGPLHENGKGEHFLYYCC